MKKSLLLTTLVLAGVTAFGQGSVTFSNSGGTAIRRTSTGANTPAGSTFQAALYWAPKDTLDADFDTAAQQLGAASNFGPTAGFFSGGGRTINNLTPPGDTAKFQIRVWETQYGSSYDIVKGTGDANAEIGKSATFLVDTANPLIGEPNASMGALIPVFTVDPVPEPSVIGLGLLGVGTLLMLRRRK